MTTPRLTKELDTRDCKSLYQVKVALDAKGKPTVASVEMLTRGQVRITTDGIEPHRFELPREFERFMEALKSEGLLNSWTCWVVKSAAATLRVLPAPVTLAINVDPRELLAQRFLTALEDGIPEAERNRVTLELTEQSPLPEDSAGKTLLSQLVKSGFKLSIDDFCKIPKPSLAEIRPEDRAHSHVYYLATLPVSEVKVDMSCAQTIMQEVGHPVEKLMHWICSLPAFMEGLTVVVEGVESEKDFPRDFLEHYYGNKDVLFQGYAYSQNIELNELLAHPALPIVVHQPAKHEATEPTAGK